MDESDSGQPKFSADEFFEGLGQISPAHRLQNGTLDDQHRIAEIETKVGSVVMHVDGLRHRGRIGEALNVLRTLFPKDQHFDKLITEMTRLGIFLPDEIPWKRSE